MGALVFLFLIAGTTALALMKSQRWAPWLLGVGALVFGGLWLLGRLRIPWPDLGIWTVFVLNPYLILTLSFAFMVSGFIGTAVRVLRVRYGWFSGTR